MTQPPEPLQRAIGPALTIIGELGGGGMSRVFLARDEALGRDVVVKVLLPTLVESISAERFTREIKVAAALQEPHIVPLLTAGETDDGLPYYIMPFIRGESLRVRMNAGRVPPTVAIGILRNMLQALDYAHAHEVVHRDIKPENILLSSGTAMVTDFGIAKAFQMSKTSAPGAALTEIGMSLGTPAYMAPEQAAGDSAVDHRADLYAWGVVAYELLSGRHPFANRTSTQQLIAAHIAEAPAALAADVPGPVVDLVMRCLSKDPSRRPATAGEALTTLDRVASSDGARASPRRIAAGIVAAIMVTALCVAILMRIRGARDAGETGLQQSVGVAPFVDLSGSSANDYFSDGVTQEITDALAKVPGLRVAGESPTPTSRNASRNPREIGRSLGVQTVLQGSVQRVGVRVRISAHLTNARTGFHLWSAKYDRDLKDVFALQDEIARAVVSGLRMTLAVGTDTLVRVATADPEAYILYLQGMYFWNQRGADMLHKSIEYFDRAIARDPRFARAYAGKALAYAVLVSYEDLDVPHTLRRAIDAADTALQLDSTLADAYTAIGNARSQLWENAAGLRAFRQAIALDSNNARARQWYAEALSHVGRMDEALQQIYRARTLEPVNLIINANVGRIELVARHYAAAAAALKHTIELDSTQQTAHSLLGAVYLQEGKPAAAIKELERSLAIGGWRSGTICLLAHANIIAGRRAEGEKLLGDVERRRAAGEVVSYAGLALVYDALGQRSRALALLDTSVARFDPFINMHSREAIYDPLRRDPRGAAILARAGSR